jgi:hypothetical protein
MIPVPIFILSGAPFISLKFRELFALSATLIARVTAPLRAPTVSLLRCVGLILTSQLSENPGSSAGRGHRADADCAAAVPDAAAAG